MGYGFEVAGLLRIMSATMAANTASRRVMDKCGLRPDCDSPRWGASPATMMRRPAMPSGHPLAGGTPAEGGDDDAGQRVGRALAQVDRPVHQQRRETVDGAQGRHRHIHQSRHEPKEEAMSSMARGKQVAVDLAGYPELVVIYLGMRVNTPRGLKTRGGAGSSRTGEAQDSGTRPTSPEAESRRATWTCPRTSGCPVRPPRCPARLDVLGSATAGPARLGNQGEPTPRAGVRHLHHQSR